jgi:hypothetical protein
MIPSLPRCAVLAAVAGASAWTAGDGHLPADGPVPPGQARFAGIVMGRDEAVSGVVVSLTGTSWRRYTTTTGTNGRFVFSGVHPDRYVLTATKDEYLEAAFGDIRPIDRDGLPAAIAIDAGQQIDGLTLRLSRGGVLSGIVRAPDGRPAAETLVTVAVGDGVGMTGMARTDAGGQFRIAGLPAGDYDVVAQPAEDSVPVYYPGVTNPARAERVPVAEDALARHVELTLAIAPPVGVAGIVRDSAGRPVAGAQVGAVSGAGQFLRTTTASSGRFVLDRVVPGRYTIEARTAGPGEHSADARRRAARGGWARATVEVSGRAISGVALTLQPALTVSGHVELDYAEPSRPADPTAIRVFLTRPDMHPEEARVRADGTFTIDATPGRHLVTATAPSSSVRLRSAMAGGRDLLDDPLVLDEAGSDVADVVLTFTDRDTEIFGRLLGPNDEPVWNRVVVVFPGDPAQWHAQSRRLAVVRPASDGRFAIRDLPAGDYLLAVAGDRHPESWKTPAFLSPLARTAVTVRLAEGGRVRHDLRIQR